MFPWWWARVGAGAGLRAIEPVLAAVPADATDPLVAELTCHASSLAMGLGHLARARELAQRSLSVAERSGHRAAVLDANIMVARVDAREGRLPTALGVLAPVIDEARRSGLDKLLADALNVVGQVQLDLQDRAGALASFSESAMLSRRLGHAYDAVVDSLCLAALALESGDAGEARRWMGSVASLRAALDHRYTDLMWLDLAAWLAAVEQDWPRAVRSFRIADRYAESLQRTRSEHWRKTSSSCLDRAREALGEAAFQAPWQSGEVASLAAAVGEADEWIAATTVA
jgi:hypothetical protein